MGFDDKKIDYLKTIVNKTRKNKDRSAFFDLSEFQLDRREDVRVEFVKWLNKIDGLDAKTMARALIQITVTMEFVEKSVEKDGK